MYFNILILQTAMDKTKFFMDESYFLMHSCYAGKKPDKLDFFPYFDWIFVFSMGYHLCKY